ncbi:MAG: endonuclease III domain-containing protein, partial [bacterium]
MNIKANLEKLLDLYEYLKAEEKIKEAPVFELYSIKSKDKWLTVWGTILSSRTRDKSLIKVMKDIETRFRDPFDVVAVSLEELEKLLKPLGFYKSKAKIFWKFNKEIIDRYKMEIPKKIEELIKLPGVGLKVGSIILNDLYGYDFIGVDVHVFRILKRVGFVVIKNPEYLWKILHSDEVKKVISKEVYKNLNRYVVAFGQT